MKNPPSSNEGDPAEGPKSDPGWDARRYHAVANPQTQWGLEVARQFDWREDDRVLDAGCGSGRLSRELLTFFPKGRLIAVDADPSMAEAAAESLAAPLAAGRAEVHQASLLEFSPSAPVDVVFSNATFHWILDHDRLWRRCFDWLVPGGRVCVQCGGEGNLQPQITMVGEIARELFGASVAEGLNRPTLYAGGADTERRLVDCGYENIEVWLEPKPTVFEDRAAFEAFARTVFLRPYRGALAEEQWKRLLERWIDRSLESYGPRLDYVRLNVRCSRPE